VHVTTAWDEALSRRLYAAADQVLIPSRFEPCGLVQLLAQRYGALPVAHAVGGLVDTIVDGENGILFRPLGPDELAAGVTRGAELFSERGAEGLRRALLSVDVSWREPAARWEGLLEDAAREASARV
jgi:starch synthase